MRESVEAIREAVDDIAWRVRDTRTVSWLLLAPTVTSPPQSLSALRITYREVRGRFRMRSTQLALQFLQVIVPALAIAL